MPKGGLLHVHQNASVEAKTLLDLALSHPAIHIRVPGPLDAASLETVLPTIQPIPVEQYPVTDVVGITDVLYTGGWVPIKKARELFDPALGGPARFDKWVLSAFMINPSDAYDTYNTPMKVSSILRYNLLNTSLMRDLQIWMKFGSTFGVTDVSLCTGTRYARLF
jgi:adenosine deaminase CECR1